MADKIDCNTNGKDKTNGLPTLFPFYFPNGLSGFVVVVFSLLVHSSKATHLNKLHTLHMSQYDFLTALVHHA